MEEDAEEAIRMAEEVINIVRREAEKIEIKDKQELLKLINEIYDIYNPCTIIIHGSAVKNNYVEKISDIDLIVISQKFEKINMGERFIKLLENSQRYNLKAEIFGYTKEEIIRMIKNLNFFILDAIYYGIPLKDDGNFWMNIIEEFRKVEKEYCLEKTETDGWKFKN